MQHVHYAYIFKFELGMKMSNQTINHLIPTIRKSILKIFVIQALLTGCDSFKSKYF